MNGDLPTMVSNAYASHCYNPEQGESMRWDDGGYVSNPHDPFTQQRRHGKDIADLLKQAQSQGIASNQAIGNIANKPKGNLMASPSVRIVKVFIVDPDDRLPLEKRVLHKGEEQLTDLTDQELFFELPMSQLLKDHNQLRTSTIDKEASKKDVENAYLEPVRVRDLKMVVTTVASF